MFQTEAFKVLTKVRQCLAPLELTHELPDQGSIQFLDICLSFKDNHVCWCYEPRANKPLLPYNSAHSKLVKRGIVKLCFRNALNKSCPHLMKQSFDNQGVRLSQAGYPKQLLVSVAEALLKELKKGGNSEIEATPIEKRQTAVIPYVHKLSHNLKKIAERSKVRVVFSAPNKLRKLCRMTDPRLPTKPMCNKKHKNRFVACAEGVVYSLPLECGKRYIGQTGRCLNERLREHSNNVNNNTGGWLASHCKQHGCKPLFDKCAIVAKHKNQLTQDILEAHLIAKAEHECVSTASVALSNRERGFLSRM